MLDNRTAASRTNLGNRCSGSHLYERRCGHEQDETVSITGADMRSARRCPAFPTHQNLILQNSIILKDRITYHEISKQEKRTTGNQKP